MASRLKQEPRVRTDQRATMQGLVQQQRCLRDKLERRLDALTNKVRRIRGKTSTSKQLEELAADAKDLDKTLAILALMEQGAANDTTKGDKFYLFTILPIELRLKIWRETLPGPRVVELKYCKKSQEGVCFTPSPVALHVCFESRQEAMITYSILFDPTTTTQQAFIDVNQDILYYSETDLGESSDLKRLQLSKKPLSLRAYRHYLSTLAPRARLAFATTLRLNNEIQPHVFKDGIAPISTHLSPYVLANLDSLAINYDHNLRVARQGLLIDFPAFQNLSMVLLNVNDDTQLQGPMDYAEWVFQFSERTRTAFGLVSPTILKMMSDAVRNHQTPVLQMARLLASEPKVLVMRSPRFEPLLDSLREMYSGWKGEFGEERGGTIRLAMFGGSVCKFTKEDRPHVWKLKFNE